MRTVYADAVLITNLCIDYIILYLASYFLHMKTSFIRMALASVFGGIYAVFMAIFSPKIFVRVISEITVLFVMAFIAFGKKQIKTYVKILLSMLVFSLLFGGMITMFIVNGKISINGLLTVVFCAVFGFFSVKSLQILQLNLRVKKVKVKIENMGKMCELTLICDNGNLLVDPYTLNPVILIDKMYKNELIQTEVESIKSCIRLVPVKTICGKSLIEVFTPEAVIVTSKKNRRVNASVGFVPAECFISDECSGIIPDVIIDNL